MMMNPIDLIMQRFGGVQNLMTQVNNMQQQFFIRGIDPRNKVQEIMNSGQMTQEQFNFFGSIADAISRMRYH